MRAVLQRVTRASVTGKLARNAHSSPLNTAEPPVDGEVISEIGRGLLVLIGIDKSEPLSTTHCSITDTLDDQKSDSDILTKKILGAKLFEDPGDAWGSWKRSVKDIDGEVLCGKSLGALILSRQGRRTKKEEATE